VKRPKPKCQISMMLVDDVAEADDNSETTLHYRRLVQYTVAAIKDRISATGDQDLLAAFTTVVTHND
jgi:hypothetical protein